MAVPPSPMPVSPVPSHCEARKLVKDVCCCSRPRLPLEAEVRDALRIRQQESEILDRIFLSLRTWILRSLSDFLAVLDLLDHVRHGYFDMVHNVPSASTWSRSRHSEQSGQPPLRSRSSPLGLSSLSPAETEKSQRSQSSFGKLLFGSRSRRSNAHQKSIGLKIIFSRRLGRTLSTWSLFHMGTTGVSFS